MVGLKNAQITAQGWLRGAQWLLSPNHNQRPDGQAPELIVIHGISLPPNQFWGQGVHQLFTNQLPVDEDVYYHKIADLRVSSHLFIRRDGSVIQYVPFTLRAWHAGVSCYRGRDACNDFSIGIELEGSDFTPYTAIQYQALADVIQALWGHYPTLRPNAVTGHSDIAPGRKTDPGEYFMWSALERLLGTKFEH